MAEEAWLEVRGVGLEFQTALELLIQAHKAELRGTSAHPSLSPKHSVGHGCLSPKSSPHHNVPAQHHLEVHCARSDAIHLTESSGDACPQKSLRQWLGEASTNIEAKTSSNPQIVAGGASIQDSTPLRQVTNSEKSSQKGAAEGRKPVLSRRQTRAKLRRGGSKSSDEEQGSTVGISPQPSGASSTTSRSKPSGGSEEHKGSQMFTFNFHGGLQSSAPIDEPDYDVIQCYYDTGCLQAIAKSPIFSSVTLAVIAINAVYMGVESDHNREESLNDADAVFRGFENCLCVFFTLELFIRFGAFKFKSNCLHDGWFKFDSALLLVIWWETWIMPHLYSVFSGDKNNIPSGPFQLMRLLRLARLARLLRAFPELVTMVKGMLLAARAVGSAMLLLILAIYAWAIIMHSFMKEEARKDVDGALYEYWGTMSRCMMTLMGNGTLGDSIGTVMRGVARKPHALAALIAFIIFSMLTVLNMLVGVLCEVVQEVAHAEKDNIALSKLKESWLVRLKRIDKDGSGSISKGELLGLLQDEEAVQVMEELNINVDYLIDILDMHYKSQESVAISFIMKLLIDSKGDRPVTVADLCSFSTFSHWAMEIMVETLHVEIKFLKQTLHGTAQIVDDLDGIKKQLASLATLGCRSEATEAIIPISLPTTPADHRRPRVSITL